MKKRVLKWLFALPLIIIIAFMLRDTFTQEGITDLAGGFEEVAFVRNEQNKGGIIRIYAFTVTDSTNADYLACGNLLPHNEYGSTTKAYFFLSDTPFPTVLNLDTPHFDLKRYHPIAHYVRNEQTTATVRKTP